ncbi:hypothetical protein A3850_008560 [Lewinella sp. 4G2]|nr:hypothetical protein A3850_008560 [Lewinella sp. 4G2]
MSFNLSTTLPRLLPLFFLALFTAPAAAQTAHYVSPNGNNDNDGSSLSSAWQTLKYALAELPAGDTLYIDDGLYQENGVELRGKIATAEKPTVVKSINQWGAKIESTAQYNTIFHIIETEHAVVDGIEVFNLEDRPYEDWNSGISIFQSNHVVVQNCYSHDCGCGGFGGRESDYMTFLRNVARDNAKTNPYNCSGISIYQPIQKDDKPGIHIYIAENVCFENECRLPFEPGGFDHPTDGNGIILDDFNWTQNNDDNIPAFVAQTLVENNLCFNNGGSGAKAFEVANAIFRNNTTAFNNYVIEEVTTGLGDLAAEFVTGQVEFYNNIAVQTFGQRGHAFNYDNKRGSNLIFENNLVVGNARFNGPTSESGNDVVTYDEQSYVQFRQVVPDDFEFSSVDDFRQFFALRPGSPGLDVGDPAQAPATDLTGAPRPQGSGIDLGAFEGPMEGVGPLPVNQVLKNTVQPSVLPINVDGIKEQAYLGREWSIDRNLIGSPRGNDLTASWTSVWDDEALYLIIDVTDNDLKNDSNDPRLDDGVEIFIDADNSRGMSYDGLNDFHYVIGWGDNEAVELSFGATDGVETRQRSLFTGYVKEVKIPWATLGIDPTEGTLFGFDVHVNDDDNGRDNLEGRLSWQARGNAADTDPSLFGSILLSRMAPIPAVKTIAADSRITIDGVREDLWDNSPTLSLTNCSGRERNGEDDLAGEFSMLWDDRGLYFFVSVTDDDLVNDSRDFFQDDGVEILLDLGYNRSESVDGNDHRLTAQYNGGTIVSDFNGNISQGTSVRFMDTDKGYDAEISLPWFALGTTPNAGMFLGLDVVINDDDGSGNADHRVTWFSTDVDAAEKPNLFGTTFLDDRLTAIFNPSVAQPFLAYPNPSSGNFRLDVPVEGQMSVQVADMQGRPVLNKSGFYSGSSINLSHLPSGNYVATATTADGLFRQMLQVNR